MLRWYQPGWTFVPKDTPVDTTNNAALHSNANDGMLDVLGDSNPGRSRQPGISC